MGTCLQAEKREFLKQGEYYRAIGRGKTDFEKLHFLNSLPMKRIQLAWPGLKPITDAGAALRPA